MNLWRVLMKLKDTFCKKNEKFLIKHSLRSFNTSLYFTGYQNLLRALKSEIVGARVATMSKTLILVPGSKIYSGIIFP